MARVNALLPQLALAAVLLFDGHRLYVGARKTTTWDDDVDRLEVTLDGEPVGLPEEAGWVVVVVDVQRRAGAVHHRTRTKAANGVMVTLDGRFNIMANFVPITEEESRVHRYGVNPDDCLAYLDLAFKFDTLTGDVHGVVGQTYRSDYVGETMMS